MLILIVSHKQTPNMEAFPHSSDDYLCIGGTLDKRNFSLLLARTVLIICSNQNINRLTERLSWVMMRILITFGSILLSNCTHLKIYLLQFLPDFHDSSVIIKWSVLPTFWWAIMASLHLKIFVRFLIFLFIKA